MDLPLEYFHHDPLEYTIQSIRVVQIQPDCSSDGHIQCRVIHTTIDDKYTCLSYVWGPPEPSKLILVNGKWIIVRQNLFDFLDTIRTIRGRASRFWIDALCINQADIPERNKQVQQMGLTYSYASHVLVWLGNLPSIRSVENIIYPRQSWRRILDRDPKHYRRRITQKDIYENEYWNRAWVRQEILLAQRISVLLKGRILDFHRFLIVIRYHFQRLVGETDETLAYSSKIAQYVTLKPFLLEQNTEQNWNPPMWKLGPIELLDSMGDASCAVFHDRVFSLTTLCHEGQSFKVDYAVSKTGLIYQVLERCPRTLCICSLHLLARKILLFRYEPSEVDDVGSFIELRFNPWQMRSTIIGGRGSHRSNLGLLSENVAESSFSHAGNVTVRVNPCVTSEGELVPPERLRSTCTSAQKLARGLSARSMWLFSSMSHKYDPRKSRLEAPIQVPNHMRHFMRQAANSLDQASGRRYTVSEGLSFGLIEGHACSVRISLDLILNIFLEESWASAEPPLCACVENQSYDYTAKLGFGAWNTNSDDL